ncbi:MAG: efflux RND transporter periplasmic adaptor subunit [Defluviitaleaceae bacterium]|nr:efflux RND transporter periplasmic adaptor subunit [Defluviitaleaceae bacterium]
MTENQEVKTSETEASETPDKKKNKWQLIIVLAITAVLLGGSGTGFFFIWRSAGYLTTDNARVTTTLVSINANIPGTLERFTIYQGRYVEENEVLGWVENGEALRAPFDGLVVQANAVQDQLVSPMESLAVIADISDLHIQANIEETDIGRITVGQPAIVTIDPFGSRQFNGYISEIGLVTAAELTGQAMFFNTGGTFTRVTHLIPIKITITDDVSLDSVIGVNARVRIPLR